VEDSAAVVLYWRAITKPRHSHPNAGDVVWISFNPQERAGHRPAPVLTPAAYNAKTGLMICCPMTIRIKGYPFEVLLASQSRSAVLADDMKNLDWRARKATRKGKTSDAELAEVRGKLRALLG
jgi:mRNA interferase MazF